MTATVEATKLVRSERALWELAKEHIDAGDTAAKEAAEPHYREAAPILAELKETYYAGNTAGFYKEAEKRYRKSRTTVTAWLGWSRVDADKPFKSLHETKHAPKSQGGLGWTPRLGRSWTQPVDEIAERARREAFRIAQEDALSRAEEREAERKLANRLIDIGWRVLSKELHPDKMHGDKTAQQRLNRVRDKLKHSI
jgi:hypothetical protein